ncbi:DUF768 domain-containing protein [Enterovirga aerilata]|uniref:DUF768 domain-containing protein n=1 Tax=Enterovirga aerilata TaxID=2730920 RepID=A0A849IGY0_9HYPH|nr:DUF768 domain-containing protein [Enterovirga sp. DB1703]NNM75197.1 DUF768 domain-containing protein [Enterovirga sp. DB1703]
MSERGAEFLIRWVERNINPEEYPAIGDRALAEVKAGQCLAEAEAAGLTRRELEAEVGPLAEFINLRMSTPPDPEGRWAPEAPPLLH